MYQQYKESLFKALTHKVESNLFSAMINEVFAGKKKIQSKAHTMKKKRETSNENKEKKLFVTESFTLLKLK